LHIITRALTNTPVPITFARMIDTVGTQRERTHQVPLSWRLCDLVFSHRFAMYSSAEQVVRHLRRE
jgi:hypothetical protein